MRMSNFINNSCLVSKVVGFWYKVEVRSTYYSKKKSSSLYCYNFKINKKKRNTETGCRGFKKEIFLF